MKTSVLRSLRRSQAFHGLAACCMSLSIQDFYLSKQDRSTDSRKTKLIRLRGINCGAAAAHFQQIELNIVYAYYGYLILIIPAIPLLRQQSWYACSINRIHFIVTHSAEAVHHYFHQCSIKNSSGFPATPTARRTRSARLAFRNSHFVIAHVSGSAKTIRPECMRTRLWPTL